MATKNLLDAMIAQTKLSKKTTDKQQRIVEAAITLFAEKGFANTSTSEIARAAEVAEGTIFRHYGTKDNLLLSVLLPFIKNSLPTLADEVFAEVFSENIYTFEDVVRAFIKNRLSFLKENKEVFQIFVKELLYREELRIELLPFFGEVVMRRLQGVIEVFKERGELIDLPSDTLLKLIYTTVGGFFISSLLIFPETTSEEEEKQIDEMVSYIMDGVRKRSGDK